MKTGKTILGTIVLLAVFSFSSCKKEECYECHYDGPGGAEVELGEKCGDEVADLEANGYALDGTVYVVHCNEH